MGGGFFKKLYCFWKSFFSELTRLSGGGLDGIETLCLVDDIVLVSWYDMLLLYAGRLVLLLLLEAPVALYLWLLLVLLLLIMCFLNSCLKGFSSGSLSKTIFGN